MKNAKNSQFWRVFENLKLAVKQCYQTCQFVKDKNWLKMLICDILGNFQTLCPYTFLRLEFVFFRFWVRTPLKQKYFKFFFIFQVLDLSDSPNLVSIGAGLLAETPSMTVISVSGCHQLSIEAKAFTFPSQTDGRVTGIFRLSSALHC